MAEGVKFERAYSSAPVCAPTRASLLSGRHQGVVSVRGNREIGGWKLNTGEGQFPIDQRDVVMPKLFKQAGYETAIVGKWGLGAPGSESTPTRSGFDYFFGSNCQRQAHNYDPPYLWQNDQIWLLEKNTYFDPYERLTEAPSDWSRWTGKQYSVDVIDARTEQWVRAHANKKPFFLFVATPLPHASLQIPTDLADQYPADWDQSPYLGTQGDTPTARPRATYAAMITRLDAQLGMLRRMLTETGQLDNTIIVFTSDNGPAPNAGVDQPFFNSLNGLRGMKTNIWEGGIRVPQAIWAPRLLGPKVTRQFTQTADLLPTLCEAVGLKKPSTVTGESLWAHVTGKQAERPRTLYWEAREASQQAVIIDSRWKAIRPRLKQDTVIELSDLISDPGERANLAAQNPAILARAETLMKGYHVPNINYPLAGIDPAPAKAGRSSSGVRLASSSSR